MREHFAELHRGKYPIDVLEHVLHVPSAETGVIHDRNESNIVRLREDGEVSDRLGGRDPYSEF